MKNKAIILAALIMGLTSCTNMNRVEPNFEGVLMQNYGRNGKSDFKQVTGAQGYLGWGSELYQVPMYEQKADGDSIRISTKDGGSFSIDPNYTYQAMSGHGVDIIFNYRHVGDFDKDAFMDGIEKGILNNIVNNAYKEEARGFTADSLVSNMNIFEKKVEERLSKEFNNKFFSLLTLTSGLTPPKSMVDAINAKNNSVQVAEKIKNDLNVSKNKLEQAKIDAQADIERSKGLTPEIIKLKQIEAIESLAKSGNAKIILLKGDNPFLLQ